MALPAPFEAVHLLFINLLTDSLPAIAIGMEPARDGLLDQKPRDPKEPILTRDFLSKIGVQGFLIAVVTMISFYIGYQNGDACFGFHNGIFNTYNGTSFPRIQLPWKQLNIQA